MYIPDAILATAARLSTTVLKAFDNIAANIVSGALCETCVSLILKSQYTNQYSTGELGSDWRAVSLLSAILV
ncbi:hypothetical protein RhiXN_03590 [Rhizoctonia solani]|uniref:Uncharacterized protein n=1 Tax=Rhizoctonia solani TaxID=456999 RepID=A0A8H8NKU5_9AGAM|nr:uncharacterized protein RhiXN_03590 [Rhizoctonia solani]QRW15589.1 hypothetical protein RhiXN_03590 [Rhizoctonia solani]